MNRIEKMIQDNKEKKQEEFSARTDYLKHITTLSAGSIILIATFLGNVFRAPIWKPAIVIALVGFMVGIIAATVSYTIVLLNQSSSTKLRWLTKVNFFLVLLILSGFMVGLVGTGIFAIINILFLPCDTYAR
jgi:hypothetical protein